MGFLDEILLGNAIRSWLIALGAGVATYATCHIGRRLLLRYLGAIAARSPNRWDDVAIDLARRTSRIFFIALAVCVALEFLIIPRTAERLAHHLVVITVVVQAGIWGRAFIRVWINDLIAKRVAHDKASVTSLSVLGFLSQLILWVTVVLIGLDNLGVDVTALVAGLGIGGVALALAVQNILADLFASLAIVLDKPFVIGDFIQAGDMMGTVEKIGLKTTRVRSLTGEILVFSHSDLLKSRIHNYRDMLERRVLFTLSVVYETPPEKVAAIPAILKRAIEEQPETRFDRSHFLVWGDSGLIFETVYYVKGNDYNVYAAFHHAVNLAILRSFAESGIEFAYPTRRLISREKVSGTFSVQ